MPYFLLWIAAPFVSLGLALGGLYYYLAPLTLGCFLKDWQTLIGAAATLAAGWAAVVVIYNQTAASAKAAREQLAAMEGQHRDAMIRAAGNVQAQLAAQGDFNAQQIRAGHTYRHIERIDDAVDRISVARNKAFFARRQMFYLVNAVARLVGNIALPQGDAREHFERTSWAISDLAHVVSDQITSDQIAMTRVLRVDSQLAKVQQRMDAIAQADNPHAASLEYRRVMSNRMVAARTALYRLWEQLDVLETTALDQRDALVGDGRETVARRAEMARHRASWDRFHAGRGG